MKPTILHKNSIIVEHQATGTDGGNMTRNNLKFYDDGNGWKVYKVDDLGNYISADITEDVKQYNTILVKEFENAEIAPGGTTDTTLTLSQVMTSNNKAQDQLKYGNIAEVIEYTNNNGRIITTSIVGNRNPNRGASESEEDDDMAEDVTILPPFGENRVYYVLGLGIAIITLAGVVIIRRMVCKK